MFPNSRLTVGTQELRKKTRQLCREALRTSAPYSVSETDGVISYHIEGSTYPNWKGTQQERLFKLSADELTLTNSTTFIGAGTAYSVWKAVK
jgi:hypothetical protein